MNKVRVVISDIGPGKFSSYIPITLRDICGVDIAEVVNSVPPEHANQQTSTAQMLVEAARSRAQQADLIIITGGVDINPRIYGQEPHKQTDQIPMLSCRDEVETAMIHTALEFDIPMIQICRGYQLGLVLIAGDVNGEDFKFCQHLPDVTSAVHRAEFFTSGKEIFFNTQYTIDNFYEDMMAGRRSPMAEMENLTHKVKIFPGTIKHYLYKRALEIEVNDNEPLIIDELSSHHQGFVINKKLAIPNNLICSALSLAGDEVPILEGYEDHSRSLCIGFQWHPEVNASGRIREIMKIILDYAEFRKENKGVKFQEWANINVGYSAAKQSYAQKLRNLFKRVTD